MKKAPIRDRSLLQPVIANPRVARSYFRDVLTLEYVLLRVVPRPLTTATIASAMPAAISAYSMAVAADSSLKNFKNIRDKSNLLVLTDARILPVPQMKPSLEKAKIERTRVINNW
jgi:hypothetical protein